MLSKLTVLRGVGEKKKEKKMEEGTRERVKSCAK